MLPPGLDPAIFTPEQLEYLEDLYTETLHHHLRQYYHLLRTMPPGTPINAARIGINAAILCKLLSVTEPAAAAPWHTIARQLNTSNGRIYAHLRAILHRLRLLNPKIKNHKS